MFVYIAAYGAKLASHNALNCCDQKEYDNSAMPQLAAMIFSYLTTVESFKLAAQTFEKDVSKLS